ncbi:type IV secretion system protein [Bacillus cereus]|uniref:type IV secretion system protein n=1 Tax=Bacillus cereus group TaxID=86661 RepID=UPI0018A751B3|nr:type IV secretion system protein [Bacillus cereus]MBF8118238.1 type IV secretion system protein [Bacillus cereus]
MGDWIAEKAWKAAESIVQGFWDALWKPFEAIPTFFRLVYGYKDDTLVYNTFSPSEITGIISPGVGNLTILLGFILVFSMVHAAIKFSSTSINPANRTYFFEFVRDWLFVILVLGNLGVLYDVVFTLNKGVIEFFKSSLDLTGKDIYPPLKDNIIGGIFARLVLFFVTIWAYFYYLMRKITLLVLMILGPIFVSLFMFPSTRQVTFTWFKEFIGTVFVQAVHALLLWTIATIVDKGTGFGVIDKASDIGLLTIGLLYIIIIPLGEHLKNLLNLGSGMNDSLSRFATMSGMAGLGNMANVVKGAMDGRSAGEITKGLLNRGLRGANSQANKEQAGNTDAAQDAVANDASARRMFRMSEVVSRGGKMIGGLAGAAGGMALGPAGSTIGSLAGFKAGGAVRPIGRGMYAAAKGVHGFTKGGFKGAKEGIKEALEGENIRSLLDQQGDFDTANWAKDNKEDFMKKLEEKGVTGKAAEQAWNKKLNDQKKYFKNRAREAYNQHGLAAFDTSKARASELAEEAANELLDQYSNSVPNKEAFKKQFLAAAQERGIEVNDAMLEKAWKQHLGEKRQDFLTDTRNIANNLTKGKGLDSFVDKGQFEELMQKGHEHSISGQENAFKDYYKAKNPNATTQEINDAWNEQKGLMASNFSQGLHSKISSLNQSPYGTGQQALGSAMAKQFANDFREMYGNESGPHKEAFVKKLKEEHPTMQQIEIDRAWNEHVEEKYNDVLNAANNVAKQLSTTPNVDNVLNKKDFAKALQHSDVAKQYIDSQEAAFKQNYVQSNPNVTPEEINGAWENHRMQLHENMGATVQKSMAKVANTIPALATQARAVDLINAVTNDSMRHWLDNNNKTQFAEELKSRPGNENMTQTEIDQAWNNHVADQKVYYKQQATQAAQELTNGKPLDSFIDKGQFKQNVQSMRLQQAKDAFYKQHEGQASPEQIEKAWASTLPGASNVLSRELDGAIGRVNPNSSIQGVISGTHARGVDLVEQATTDLTRSYVTGNKDSFYAQKLNEGMGIKEIDNAWQQNVEGYKNQVFEMATNTMEDLTGGQSQYAFVDKNQFGHGLTARRIDAAREDFGKQFAGASPEFIDKQWDRSGIESKLVNESQQVIANVPKIQATKGYELGEFMASHQASTATDQWANANKEQFFKQQRANGIAEPQIQQAWNEAVGVQYADNLATAQQEIANSSSKNVVIPRQIGAVVKGLTLGGTQGAYEGSGVKNFIEAGKDMINYQVFDKVPVTNSLEEAEQKQMQMQKTFSFAAGVLGGEKAYQKVAGLTTQHSPYAAKIQDSVMEVGDIVRYAQKEQVFDPQTNQTVERIPNNAIRMVVEPERSFLQVKGEDGRYVRVSPYGVGSSELKQGEVLYQDQAIVDNTLVPRSIQGSNSTFYKLDSMGLKSITDHVVPAKASDLLSNRHQIINAEQVVHFDSFSPEVDQGNFTLKDFSEHSADNKATWVVEKNRSYMVMNDHNNRKLRVTPYFDGNPQLPFGETIFKEFIVEGGRLKGFSKGVNLNAYRVSGNGEPLLVDPELFPNVDVNTYLRPEPNKRLMRRKLVEERRFKQGV